MAAVSVTMMNMRKQGDLRDTEEDLDTRETILKRMKNKRSVSSCHNNKIKKVQAAVKKGKKRIRNIDY